MIAIPDVQKVIYQALVAIGYFSTAAADLVLGTGAQESGYRFTHQIGGGPALGLWQIEPATHDSLWNNFIKYHPALSSALLSLAGVTEPIPPSDILVDNSLYAAAMCRVRYLDSPGAIPADLPGQAAYYKANYNGPGAATSEEFIANWNALVAPTRVDWATLEAA